MRQTRTFAPLAAVLLAGCCCTPVADCTRAGPTSTQTAPGKPVVTITPPVAVEPKATPPVAPPVVVAPPVAVEPKAAPPVAVAPPVLAAPPVSPPKAAGPAEATRAAVLAAIDEVREEVAKVRGLAWKKVVPADLLTREQLAENIERMTKEEFDPVKYAKSVRVAKRFGMLGDDEDPLEITKRFLGVGVLGYFDPDEKRFFLIDGPSALGQKPVIAHELTHALDDQYFDLKAMTEPYKEDSDRVFALKCVQEGCAEIARMRFEKAHPETAVTAPEEAAKQAGAQIEALKSVPAFLVLPTLLHYKLGPVFVKRAVGDDYVGGMARLYADPPVSQEQVMHPSRYVYPDRDLPRRITFASGIEPALGRGFALLDEEGMGELDVAAWLDFHLGETGGRISFPGLAQGKFHVDAARVAAEGWDGMRVRAYEKDGAPIVIAVLSAWDSAKDAREAADAFLLAFRRQHGQKFEGGTLDDVADGATEARWTTPNGAGRARLAGDTLTVLDGLPAAELDRAWTALLASTYVRDPKDTFDAEKVPDALAGADWAHDAQGIGWRKPSAAWKVEPQEGDDTRVTLRRGDTAIEVSVKAGSIQLTAFGILGALARAIPGYRPQDHVRDAEVAGLSGARIDYTRPGDAGERGAVILAGLRKGGTLVLKVEVAPGRFAEAESALADAVEGFVSRE